MATDDKLPGDKTSDAEKSSPPQETNDFQTHHSQPLDDRALLVSKAKSFLQSPQISGQDLSSKRQFLRDKGLHEVEIDHLLHDVPASAPLIPPRTYPQPPPSPLPNLLLGLLRIFSWLAGGSAVLLFIYHRFLLPRIARSYMARHSLKNHHLTLMRRLTTSLSTFRETRAEVLSVLPKADPWREPLPYSKCSCIDDVTTSFGEQEVKLDVVPPVTTLRCGLADFTKREKNGLKPTTEELFHYLEEKVPWLLSPDGLKCEQHLWESLSSCPLFSADPALPLPSVEQQSQSPSRWSYIPPPPLNPSPILVSLSSLKLALSKDQSSKPNTFRTTLEALSELTGYISSQLFMPYRLPTNGIGIVGNLGPVEESLRKEIRALKGLVLNRRSFMPSIPRASMLPVATT